MTSDLSSKDIAAELNADALNLCRSLFPAGMESGGYYQIHSLDGAAGDNTKIRVSGAASELGRWADYNRDEGDPLGKGDMLKLIRLTVAPPEPDQKEYAAAIRWAKGWLGIESMDPSKLERMKVRTAAAQERSERERAAASAKKQLNARNLWGHAVPLIGTPAQSYLEGRGIDFAQIGRLPRVIRFRHDVWQADLHRAIPAMLIAGFAVSGEHVATHCTYLHRLADGRWTKLPPIEQVNPKTGEIKRVQIAKKIFGPYLGAHFPIHKGAARKPLRDCPAGEGVMVSEGSEDALTAAMLWPERRVLMAATLGNVGGLILPPQCGDLTLLCQRDAPGSQAALKLEKMIAAQQRRAVEDGSRRRVLGLWPGEGFKDFNDELRGVMM